MVRRSDGKMVCPLRVCGATFQVLSHEPGDRQILQSGDALLYQLHLLEHIASVLWDGSAGDAAPPPRTLHSQSERPPIVRLTPDDNDRSLEDDAPQCRCGAAGRWASTYVNRRPYCSRCMQVQSRCRCAPYQRDESEGSEAGE